MRGEDAGFGGLVGRALKQGEQPAKTIHTFSKTANRRDMRLALTLTQRSAVMIATAAAARLPKQQLKISGKNSRNGDACYRKASRTNKRRTQLASMQGYGSIVLIDVPSKTNKSTSYLGQARMVDTSEQSVGIQ